MSDNQTSSGDVPTTGHLWDDDLQDFANQPPRWWMLGLTASAIWVVVYWLLYPAIPISTGGGTFFKGIGLPGLSLHLPGTDAKDDNKWTAIKELALDQKVLDAVRGPYENKVKGMTPAAILADQDLSEYVVRSGRVLFSDNCAACHGQNGVGTVQKGKFAMREQGLMAPILNDDDWLYGGTIDTIYETITGGRQGMMVAHKDTLSAQQIDDVAHYVKAMNEEGKPKADTDPAVAAGKKVFMESDCTTCHGTDARGMKAMGSANLTDKIWRFDGSIEGIKQTVTYGVNSGDPNARVAIMPTWLKKDEQGHVVGKLDETAIKKLAVYVYKLGGGQAQ
jgi:cytochrome c oxidase cbb3-type subunit III